MTAIRRLGPHHFAHLRAVAEGIPLQQAAERYLGIEHGHQSVTAHRQVVDQVRAISRRRGDRAWRLIGLTIKADLAAADKPTLEDFIEERGLDGWSESEVADMYAEAYPADPKAQRRQRLRERQLQLIRQLEGTVAEIPRPSDMVDGWFEESIAKRMISAGYLNLGDLAKVVARGGRWYRSMPGIGKTKAARIEQHLWTLLDRASVPQERVIALPAPIGRQEVIVRQEGVPAIAGGLIQARTDAEAVRSWINARAGSPATAKVYEREGQRLLLWLAHERAGRRLAEMTSEDCLAYMVFLQNVPDRWISRRKAAPGQPGWAPFRGQLSQSSYKQSITIVSQLFGWLQSAQYLQADPWVLVNKKTGDERGKNMLDSKALAKGTMVEILRVIDESLPSPSRFRIQFLLRFVPATGIRSTELLQARLGDIRLSDDGAWTLQVHGKGAKNRLVVIPGAAYEALQDYIDRRGLGDVQSAPPEAPLLASATDPMEPASYQSLYETVRNWIKRSVRDSDLPAAERARASMATTHWLRHTFGTWAVAGEVPLDAIQAQMGHASITTTMNIYGKAPLKRRAVELDKAFG